MARHRTRQPVRLDVVVMTTPLTPMDEQLRAAVASLYWVPEPGAFKPVEWRDTYRRAIAEYLYWFAWLDDRARYGKRRAEDYGMEDFCRTVCSGEFAVAIMRANLSVRAGHAVAHGRRL